MLKAFTWSGQGREESSRLRIKTDNSGVRGWISTLFNGSRHGKWLPPVQSRERLSSAENFI